MTLSEALGYYLSRPDREARAEAAILAAAAARELDLPVWFSYLEGAKEPLKVVIDLPLCAIALPLPVLYDRPEGLREDWPALLPQLDQLMREQGIRI